MDAIGDARLLNRALELNSDPTSFTPKQISKKKRSEKLTRLINEYNCETWGNNLLVDEILDILEPREDTFENAEYEKRYDVHYKAKSFDLSIDNSTIIYFNQEYCSDIDILVDGKMFHAHKMVLIKGSGFFKNRFRDEKKPFNLQIRLDMCPLIFNVILKFLYCNKINMNNFTIEEKKTLYKASVAFFITELVNICEVNIIAEIDESNAVDIMEFGLDESIPRLVNVAGRFINKYSRIQAKISEENWLSNRPHNKNKCYRSDVIEMLWQLSMIQ